ncbi:permease [Alkaliphilus peptidifermentans]|uniref:Ferredoxin n=1 Tax=Alkaliphilus peptidifermentans DSM 18978 TaxID=1120976 RepID=A0A1G5HEP3_9FIRM|nr:permease [Alkaliphilus peptidifermentans]SCY62305.1 Ferredoxin [Alkaliphilus peptidifermentans DSM 18978]
MKVIQYFNKNKLLTIVLLIYAVLFLITPAKAGLAVKNSIYYIVEMLQIMPVVFLLTAILEAWVPKEVIMNGFGERAGLKGSAFSFILGSLSAGPIYAAFPISKMLLKKGASVTNIVIILSTWAVVKVPMLANEAKFLGPKFMGVRWILTTIAIFIMAYLTAMIVKIESIPMTELTHKKKGGEININEQYCMGCGICTRISPKNFKMKNKKAKFKENDVNDSENVNKAIEKCPVNAISN